MSAAQPPYIENQSLLETLSDDSKRAHLYHAHNTTHAAFTEKPVLEFSSHALDADDSRAHANVDSERFRSAYLIVKREDVLAALRNDDDRFSNAPYAALGTGTFLLGLDQSEFHTSQAGVLQDALPHAPNDIASLCKAACTNAGTALLCWPVFDLARYAELAALYFTTMLFGFATTDLPLLETSMQKAYLALTYQMLGRHFASEPLTIVNGKGAMAALAGRAAELIDTYRQCAGSERPDQVEDLSYLLLSNFKPVMWQLAKRPGTLNGLDLAVLVVGSVVGTIGNMRASACIAINEFFNQANARDLSPGTLLQHAKEAARQRDQGTLRELISEALRLNPPAPFLPREAMKDVTLSGVQIPAGAECVLAIGGATRGDGKFQLHPAAGAREAAAIVFGFMEPSNRTGPTLHACLGRHLALPLIEEIVRSVLLLPGLAQRLDAVTGQPIGLKKTWGFRVNGYQLLYRRDLRRKQQTLNVVMRIKDPTTENVGKIQAVLAFGAYQIERSLRSSNHVHFAWFELAESNTKLVLHTVYDGDFEAYIEYFALKVTDLFDSLFQFIDDAPPLPVGEHPLEFIETIRKFNNQPLAGYLFSAFPEAEVTDIASALPTGRKDERLRT
jgi:hypothetical protein